MILLPGFSGPLEQWQSELRQLSRSALRELAEMLAFTSAIPDEQKLKIVRQAKREGGWADEQRRHIAFMADPEAASIAALQRRLAAKKSARRRKRASR